MPSVAKDIRSRNEILRSLRSLRMTREKMENNKVYTAIGLMSGTSLDAVDAALIETDGQGFVKPLGFVSLPYEPETRAQIRACFGEKDRFVAKVVEAE